MYIEVICSIELVESIRRRLVKIKNDRLNNKLYYRRQQNDAFLESNSQNTHIMK